MSKHRFDRTVDHSDDSRPDWRPDRLQRIEVITGVERRRRWSAQDKLAIVAESLVAGVVVSEVARRHGISPQQLFGWRTWARAEMAAMALNAPPAFVPAITDATSDRKIAPIASPEPIASPTIADGGGIEISLGSTLVRVRGVVDTKMLTAVLKALKVTS